MEYNLSASNQFKNTTNNFTYDGTPNDPLQITFIITIIINIITSPVTVLLNVLVIMAVRRRPRLQTYPNILLACLAATDVLTGLISQPSFILYGTFQLLGMSNSGIIVEVSLRILCLCSLLHLMLITCDRLIAIKFTLRYLRLVTTRNIKVAVITVWIVSFISGVSRTINNESITVISDLSVAFICISCILFIVYSYVILYREILRHQKKIKIEQIPQEELERFAKEHKALKTTVFVVGALLLCFLPGTFVLIFIISGPLPRIPAFNPLFRTFLMLNSFLNPLIYCWRQEEMRKFAFRCKRQAHLPPAN